MPDDVEMSEQVDMPINVMPDSNDTMEGMECNIGMVYSRTKP